ncbi:MAG TPA: hypothetical protein VGB97_00220 [Candidatus Paceibacterota bacterium]
MSWSIWAFLSTLNALSYREMTDDWVSTLQFVTGAVACILTFLYALFSGKFAWPKPREWVVFALGAIAVLVWWKYQSATAASVIVITAFMVSFIPTYEGVIKDPYKESPMAWVLWTIVFAVGALIVVLRDKEPIALLNPILLAISHGGVALLSTRKRKARFPKPTI